VEESVSLKPRLRSVIRARTGRRRTMRRGYCGRAVGMEMELSEMLGRKVDLRTPAELSRYFRDEVVASALPQYECG
jgi:hypothetical protein